MAKQIAISEMVLERMKDMEDCWLTFNQICEMFPNFTRVQIRSAFHNNMYYKRIYCKDNKYIYTQKEIVIEKKAQPPALAPITKEEVKKARKMVPVGTRMLAVNDRKVRDSDPDTMVVTIISKHPFVCMTDKKVSFTWVEVAKYLRNRSIPLGA